MEFFERLFAADFMPHGQCLLWQPSLLWLHVRSDVVTSVAYYSIPAVLIYFIRRRRDMVFSWVFWMFGAFILACGTTHLLNIYTMWVPAYRFEGLMKAFTALLSLGMAIAMIPLIPKALALPSPGVLRKANRDLELEIAHRKKAEAELQQNTAQVQAVFDQAPIGMCIIGPRGRILRANRALEDMVGHQTDALRQTDSLSLVHPDDQAALAEAIEPLLEGRQNTLHKLEKRYMRTDGQVGWAHINLSVLTKNNRKVRLLAMVEDVTEHKKAAVAIQESEAQCRTLIEHASEAILLVDMEANRIVSANKNAEDLFGLDRAQLRQTNPIWLSPSVQPNGQTSDMMAREKVAQVLQGNPQSFEWVHQTVDGKDVLCEVHLVQLPAGDRKLVRGSLFDITEKRRMEAHLQQQERLAAVGQLAAGIAHDFNNILTVIVGSAQMLCFRPGVPASIRDDLVAIQRQGQRAAQLVRQMLDFSRKTVAQRRPVNLRAFLSEGATLLKSTLPETIQVKAELAADCADCTVKGDVAQLQQILTNLANNARYLNRAFLF